MSNTSVLDFMKSIRELNECSYEQFIIDPVVPTIKDMEKKVKKAVQLLEDTKNLTAVMTKELKTLKKVAGNVMQELKSLKKINYTHVSRLIELSDPADIEMVIKTIESKNIGVYVLLISHLDKDNCTLETHKKCDGCDHLISVGATGPNASEWISHAISDIKSLNIPINNKSNVRTISIEESAFKVRDYVQSNSCEFIKMNNLNPDVDDESSSDDDISKQFDW